MTPAAAVAQNAPILKIADLVSSRLHTRADEPTARVVRLWEEHPADDGMAVVAGSRVRYLSRARFFLHLGKKFGYSLFENRPVDLLAEDGSIVEADMDPVEVISLATQRDAERVFDDVIVVEGGGFLGLVSMRSLIVHHRGLLLDGMAERARLEERNRRLHEQHRVQSEFVNRLTSELRAPVTSMVALARASTGGAGSSSAQGRSLEALVRRAQEVLALVNDLQDLARLDAGTLEPHAADVEPAALVRAAVEGALRAKPGRAIETRLSGLRGPFRTDPLFLGRIAAGLAAIALGTAEDAASIEGESLGSSIVLRLHLGSAGIEALGLASTPRSIGAGRGITLPLAIVRRLAERLGGGLEPSGAAALVARIPCL